MDHSELREIIRHGHFQKLSRDEFMHFFLLLMSVIRIRSFIRNDDDENDLVHHLINIDCHKG